VPEPLAVLFDIDGVLVDSYGAHWRSWQSLGARYGFTRTEHEFAQTFGRTSREILAELGLGLSAQQVTELSAEKESLYRDLIREHLPIMPGALELIDALTAAGYRLAVASSGPPKNVEFVMEKLGRRSSFGAEVSGADVVRGKPDPQVFLVAAERLGVAPRRCAVVEDAAAGIAAANAAGMTSIGLVSQGRTRDELQAADMVVHRLAELSPETIRKRIEAKAHGRDV
jgi:beta-phosphoglucomutase